MKGKENSGILNHLHFLFHVLCGVHGILLFTRSFVAMCLAMAIRRDMAIRRIEKNA